MKVKESPEKSLAARRSPPLSSVGNRERSPAEKAFRSV